MKAQKKRSPRRRIAVVQRASIERRIYFVRGQRVMIDNDLADLYHVTTGAFNQAVRRNLARFPPDFMFQVTGDESDNLRSQIVISSWGGRRYLPFVFTEQGVAMLSSVLKSDRAIQVNIAIMRAFVKLREILATHKELALRLEELEKKFQKHDHHIRDVFEAIRALLAATPAKRFGYPPQPPNPQPRNPQPPNKDERS
jgi:hypothetical protein